MSDNKRNVLIGLFVLGGLVALGVLIVKFGEANWLFSRTYRIHAKFNRVSGVREGLNVSLAGVQAGRVVGVDLADPAHPNEGVVAVLEIRDEYSVPRGSEAAVEAPLMGQPTINIIPPTVPAPELPRDGTAIIMGTVKNPLERIIDPRIIGTVEKTTAQIGELAAALTPAANDLHVLLEKRTTQEVDRATAPPPGYPTTQEVTANLYTAVERLHNVLKHIEDVLGDSEVQSNLKDTLANMREASAEAKAAAGGFRAMSEQAQQVASNANAVVLKLDATVETTHKRIDDLGRSLMVNSDKISRVLDFAIAAGRDMAEGKGTIAMLLRDPQFYEELLLTVKRLNSAARELQTLIQQWQKQGILGMR